MSDFEREEQLLPGLEPPAPSESALERAARRTIAARDELKLLDERHALLCQLVLELAGAVSDGRRSRRASAAAMAAAQLIAAIQLLPEPEGGDERDEWNELVAKFRAAGSGAPARDETQP